MRVGIDVGSTTVKCVVLDDDNKLVYSSYERHYSQITQKIAEVIEQAEKAVPQCKNAPIAMSGSAGMGIASSCEIEFVQEVYATRIAANTFIPGTDVIIELGGEDAKILFLSGGMEVRMNGTCAGGTGAFIDQMATLLNVTAQELNTLAASYEKLYTIASRCGVFAKTDIQPLLNQGARKNDIAASIFCAVVNQTVAGLAQGREIKGNVVYLGGPLTFLSELRNRFDTQIGVKGICPENSLYFVAMGAALCAQESADLEELKKKISNPPLFNSKKEYADFTERHGRARVKTGELSNYSGDVYIGMDAGSTTVKAVVLSENNELLYSKYLQNSGNPVPIIKDFLEELYSISPDIKIKASAVTGYGEEIIKNAFCVDYGIVETVAHLTAAKFFMPDVEFVIDIGGQDIKCFKILKRSLLFGLRKLFADFCKRFGIFD